MLGIDEIAETAGPVPVIRRGSRSYPVDADSGGLRFIDPQPITPSIFAKANEINDLFALGGPRPLVQAWVDAKIDKLRRICRRTTEILAAQSLSGAIAYKMATEGGPSWTTRWSTPHRPPSRIPTGRPRSSPT